MSCRWDLLPLARLAPWPLAWECPLAPGRLACLLQEVSTQSRPALRLWEFPPLLCRDAREAVQSKEAPACRSLPACCHCCMPNKLSGMLPLFTVFLEVQACRPGHMADPLWACRCTLVTLAAPAAMAQPREEWEACRRKVGQTKQPACCLSKVSPVSRGAFWDLKSCCLWMQDPQWGALPCMPDSNLYFAEPQSANTRLAAGFAPKMWSHLRS